MGGFEIPKESVRVNQQYASGLSFGATQKVGKGALFNLTGLNKTDTFTRSTTPGNTGVNESTATGVLKYLDGMDAFVVKP